MTKSKPAILFALLLSAVTQVFGQSQSATCAGPAYHEFDFWVGEWIVQTSEGKPSGTSSVARVVDGCAIRERFDNGQGYRGESLNAYDESRKVWHQTWVDSEGLLLVLEGKIRDGKMVLEGETQLTDRAVMSHRITWSRSPDGSVRQVWETLSPKGERKVVFDGRYTRK